MAPIDTPPVLDDAEGDLVNDLLTQLDSRDGKVQAESASILSSMHLEEKAELLESSVKQDAKSRFKARQARKAAALADRYTEDDPEAEARLAQAAKDEVTAIQKVCSELGLQLVEINPDGHCLFSAVADQLAFLGVIPPAQASFANLRSVAANYIHAHPDDFLPFLPSTGGEDTVGANEAGLMNSAQFESYCKSVRDTAVWGGEPEIVALCRAFKIPIHVVQGERPPIVQHHPTGGSAMPNEPVVWISYHRRLYGLGEHYNSLRPIPKTLLPGHRLIPIH
ncbi:cysteine proteinase [Crepidotus variabilis]|uniref:Cysteine proteinase n=1 Tax=Crepidotus variabilis TaxID=179855 RepID=A0A9P6JTB7_9AGAR|nr:cysteine proteinase [Crepidotus variabilis]